MSACWALIRVNVWLARAALEDLEAAYALRVANDALMKATEALNAERGSRTAEDVLGTVLPSLVTSTTGGFSHLATDLFFRFAKPSFMSLTG